MTDGTIIFIVGGILGAVQSVATLYLKIRIDKVSCGSAACIKAVEKVKSYNWPGGYDPTDP